MYNICSMLKFLCRVSSLKLFKKKNPPWHKSWGIAKFLLNHQTQDDEEWKVVRWNGVENKQKKTPRSTAFISSNCSPSHTNPAPLPCPRCLPWDKSRTLRCFLWKETDAAAVVLTSSPATYQFYSRIRCKLDADRRQMMVKGKIVENRQVSSWKRSFPKALWTRPLLAIS